MENEIGGRKGIRPPRRQALQIAILFLSFVRARLRDLVRRTPCWTRENQNSRLCRPLAGISIFCGNLLGLYCARVPYGDRASVCGRKSKVSGHVVWVSLFDVDASMLHRSLQSRFKIAPRFPFVEADWRHRVPIHVSLSAFLHLDRRHAGFTILHPPAADIELNPQQPRLNGTIPTILCWRREFSIPGPALDLHSNLPALPCRPEEKNPYQHAGTLTVETMIPWTEAQHGLPN